MKSAFRIATSNDKAAIIALMREFYRVEHLFFDEQLSRAALAQLLEEPSLGAVFLIEVDDQPAGYGVVTFGFSLEFYGRFSLLDELYLREKLPRPRARQSKPDVCRKFMPQGGNSHPAA